MRMPEMCPAASASDLGIVTWLHLMEIDSISRNGLPKTGPSTGGREFRFTTEQWHQTTHTVIDTYFKEVPIGALKLRFCLPFPCDKELVLGEDCSPLFFALANLWLRLVGHTHHLSSNSGRH